MRSLISKSSNPYFNLAMEDYFLKNSNEEHFFIYINEPCVVVGKHQNLLSEINLQFTLNNNIKLARRISGGGTVYQDSNNLNFSFIHNCINPDKINFATIPIYKDLRDCVKTDLSYLGPQLGCQTNTCLCRADTLGQALGWLSTWNLRDCAAIQDITSGSSILTAYVRLQT